MAIHDLGLGNTWCCINALRAVFLPAAERAHGVAIGADKIALPELALEQARQPAGVERRKIAKLLSSGAMVESHRRRMEASAAVHARRTLQIAHSCNKVFSACRALRLSECAHRGVVSRVPDATALPAPPLMAVIPAMEFGEWFLHAAHRAAAWRSDLRATVVHWKNDRTDVREAVGVPGFEPGTFASRTQRATKLRYTPSEMPSVAAMRR